MLKIVSVAAAMLACLSLNAQNSGYDVFIPIAKYIGQGDAEALSAWFADNLEITVDSGTSDSSRSQARQIVKSFFEECRPASFVIEHTAARSNTKYALGLMSCNADKYNVTIFVSFQNGRYKIQQLKFEKIR